MPSFIRNQRSYGARRITAIFAIVSIVTLCVSGCSDSSSSGSASSKEAEGGIRAEARIVAVGDSLTAGYGVDESEAYPALLEKKLLADNYYVSVTNAGVSGETSSGALSRIDWVISSLDPDIIILETGANDGLRGIDPAVLKENLYQMVARIKENGIIPILAGMKMLPNLGPAYTARFEKVYPEIAAKYDIPLIPFFLESVAGDARFNLADRLHPNPEGYRRIVDHIYPYVLAAIKNLGSSPD
jgi:acyl-CoA thioesterase-1